MRYGLGNNQSFTNPEVQGTQRESNSQMISEYAKIKPHEVPLTHTWFIDWLLLTAYQHI